jgi:hypothetical protein
MVIKLLIIITLLILLRHHLSLLKPYWPAIVGLLAGALVGWWSASFLISSGTRFEALEYLGCPRSLIKPVFAIVGALITVKPVTMAIRELFPPQDRRDS